MTRETNMPFRAVLTRAGVRAALAAFDDGNTVAIAAVAAGDAAYSLTLDGDGRATQSRLRAERERGAARGGGETDGVRVRCVLDGSASFWVRELGFFLADGTLFAVWSDPGRTLAWKHAETPLQIDFDINLGDMPRGSVTVENGRLPSAGLLDFLAIAFGAAPEVRDHG